MSLLSADTIRRCIIADPGHSIFSADFDQIELRLAAAFARETSLIEAAIRGESLHHIAAIQLFGEGYTPDQYKLTKNGNFGWLYGSGPANLAEQLGIPFAQAKEFTDKYTREFTALNAFRRREQNKVLRSAFTPEAYRLYRSLVSRMFEFRTDTSEGRSARNSVRREVGRLCRGKIGWVVTPYGRRLPVDADKAYTVVNYLIQSTARDIMAEALLRVMDDPELEPTVLLPIHDEILGQARKSKAERIAQRYGEVMSTEFMDVPITATGKVYGRSWGHGYRKQ